MVREISFELHLALVIATPNAGNLKVEDNQSPECFTWMPPSSMEVKQPPLDKYNVIMTVIHANLLRQPGND